MLDTETKRRIDTARDILVGKVPDPKSQVEQITIAMIYKFMDDMDAEAEELGGKRSFFAGDFEKYGWSKLMAPGMGGHDVLNLYAEGITKMNENAGIPLLFRDIFKNAYLPYRDPETLKSFLKEIGHFEYDHSERLGDAFEYLLSVLGSQGDAGQFRTPRHIIDFMVEVIDPKKDESILDPACGTAGFLISSYKHILKSNARDGKAGGGLTPDERTRLVGNIKGYDISPDMVRLSMVNLYLHGFTDPHIDEYDTLTSEDKWNEYADVILANPPFMSPKGGIKPHKRFSVQSKRSEVLFVDYMAEHLTPNGRAAIIVPEGIIFQSGKAYKQLRKMMVDDYLFAVVSMPAGMFQPYSGVKTSILLMDKALAKRSDSVMFVKIESDGFDLGAQRRENGKSDLPDAVQVIANYKSAIVNGETFDADNISNVLVVEKEKIGVNGDWNLSGARYRENDELRISDYEMVELGEICENLDGKRVPITKSDRKAGQYPYYGASGIVDYVDSFIFDEDLLLISEDGANLRARVTPIAFSVSGKIWVNNHAHVLKFDHRETQLFVEIYINSINIENYVTGSAQPKLNQKSLNSIKMPLPPLEIQKEIVAEIEGYQKIIDGARAVVNNYKPHIRIEPEWEMMELQSVARKDKNSLKAGPFGSALKKDCYVKSGYKIYGQEQVIKGDANYGDYYINEDKYKELKSCRVSSDDILISLVGTYGKTLIIPKDYQQGIINPRLLKISLDNQLITSVFFDLIFHADFVEKQIENFSHGGTMNILNLKIVKQIKIPLPPLEIQNQIVAQIEKEQALVNANKELITIFEQKIKDKIASVWGE